MAYLPESKRRRLSVAEAPLLRDIGALAPRVAREIKKPFWQA